ncbi:MAG: TAXI family TRAP transporter solute-binding subunit [Sneathiellales bacterium]|nr:TAXI family TRAP transporter solute-binding subunit [Sneathiellales bacterium]
MSDLLGKSKYASGLKSWVMGIAAIAAGLLASVTSVQAEQANLGIMSGGVNGTYVRIAQNMSDALDSGDLRIITMLGKGSRQNIKDLIELDGTDLAIVQSDVLREVANSKSIPGATGSIRYITKLYNEEIHILAKKPVKSLKFLEGASVGVGRQGSGTEMTASILFGGLGIEIDPINVSGQEALEALEEDLIEAAVFVVGKPSNLLKNIGANSGYKLLDITLPKSVDFPYFETELTHKDYPGLVGKGDEVSTVAVGAILAVFNWREGSRRYKLLEKFTDQLFSSIEVLKSGPYHPKWGNIDIAVEVPSWKRFKPAGQWLEKNGN